MPKLTTKILTIDDEKSVCISCKRILEEEGHTVDYVLSGVEGVKRAIEGDYSLILLDLKIPDMSGMEVFEQLCEKRPDIIVVIITGYATIQTSIDCIKKGAADYIPKPFTPEELALAVHKALENSQLREENEFLKNRLQSKTESKIIGRSEQIEETRKQIEKIAPTDFSVLIQGESGTGKEIIAQAIHTGSLRREKPFIAVDISSLSPTLVESELFGHVKSAFTGATQSHPGFFALADSGSLFLDEISNISWELQGKLLRALESHIIRPVGGVRDQEIDIRLICATNRDLAKMVEEKKFREDLFYRINVIPIRIPPLREHPTDIPLLCTHFLKRAKKKTPTKVQGFATAAMAKLIAYDWPGNVRELKNIVERLVATTETPLIKLENLPSEILGKKGLVIGRVREAPLSVKELKEAKRKVREQAYCEIEQKFILHALDEATWNVTKAAENTGMQRTNFHALMRKYGIKSQEKGD